MTSISQTPEDRQFNKVIGLLKDSHQLSETSIYDRDDMGFTAHLWSQFSLPYREPKDLVRFERTNGAMTLSIAPARLVARDSSVSYGYPYGVLARQILFYITTQAKKTGSPDIFLGNSFNDFLSRLGISNGGTTHRRVQEHLMRLIKCQIEVSDRREVGNTVNDRGVLFSVANSYQLWFPKHDDPTQQTLFGSQLTLSQPFYDSVMERAIPLDMGALRALSSLGGAAMRIDIFVWLSYRLHKLPRRTLIPWVALKVQFGPDYARERDFRRDFVKHLNFALAIYTKAKVTVSEEGLWLSPSPAFVTSKRERKALDQA